MQDSEKLAQALAAIHRLEHTQMQHLNHLLACEAVLLRLIPMLDRAVLARLSEEFGEATVQAMHTLRPDQQDENPWRSMQAAIDEALDHKARPASGAGA